MKKIGLSSSVFIIVTSCIGSAIFSIPGFTILNAGPSAILSWIIGGIILGLYGLQVAELSVLYKKSGGMFIYPSKAINKTAGFFCAWGGLVGHTITVSFSAIFLSKYIVNYLSLPAFIEHIIALISIIFICLAGFVKLNIAVKFNNALGIIMLVLFIILGYFGIFHENFNISNFNNFFSGKFGETGWIQAISNAMLAYGGVSSMAFLVGEVKNPNSIIPKSLLIGLSITIFAYTIIIISIIGNISMQEYASNLSALQTPLIYIFQQNSNFIGKIFIIGVLILVLISILTTMFLMHIISLRTIEAAIKTGMLPKFLYRIKRKQTEIPCVLILFIFYYILLSLGDYVYELIQFGSLTTAITLTLIMISLPLARRKMQHKKDEFKAPGGNILNYITITLIVLSYIPGITSKFTVWLFALIVYFSGFMIYVLNIKLNKN